jgi:hypothetical protein
MHQQSVRQQTYTEYELDKSAETKGIADLARLLGVNQINEYRRRTVIEHCDYAVHEVMRDA